MVGELAKVGNQDFDAAQYSVVIPARNAEKSIGRALRSVASQTLPPAQVIVVNNDSSDTTVEIALRFSDELPLEIVHCHTPGSAAARNAGMAKVREKFVAFLDADDEWYPEKSALQAELLLEGAELTGTFMHYVSSDGRRIGENSRLFPSVSPAEALRSAQGMPAPLSSIMMTTDLMNTTGPFDETFRRAQDFEWLVRAAQSASLMIAGSRPLVGYRISGSSSTADAYIEQGYAADLVRRRLNESDWTLSYETEVSKRLAEERPSRTLRAGRAYRLAAVAFGERRRLQMLSLLVEAFLLAPLITASKAWRQLRRHNPDLQSAP